jgi:homocysteine S-methyltransferase
MWKVDAGAEFAVTQPVFDKEALTTFIDRTSEWPVPTLAGIWPLRSLREAEFLANEIPGVVVPEEVFERMRVAEADGEEAERAEGIAIARETVAAIRDQVRGIHLNTPGGEVERVLEVFQDLDDA